MKARALWAIVAALLAGSCAKPGDRVTLTVWAMGAEGTAIVQLVPGFEKANPGIKVDVEQLPFAEAHQKLLTGFAGDSLPDMAQLGNSWLPEFEALGALAPLDARVATTPAIDRRDYFPGIWDASRIDGRLYGVPWYVDTRLLFYRRDLLKRAGFDHPPRDWAEWRRQMVAIKRLVGPGKFAAIFPLNEYEPLEVLGLQQPEPMVTADARANFENPGFERALAFYLGTVRSGLAPAIANTEIANIWDQFDRGDFSFYITGPWQLDEFAKRIPADRQDEWATAPMPGPDGPGASNAGGSSLVIFRRSDKQDAAWKLIAYLSTPEMELRFHQLTGDLPPRRSTWRAPALAGDAKAQAFLAQLQRVKPTPKVPEWEAIATMMRTVTEAAAHNDMPAAEVAAEIDRQADAILAKRRWMLERERKKPVAGAAS
ncbi:extracellular solute-binding protein [Hephaestia mangrovi]|uniref:extracellular solute-binding protein n=1 Tax=Hephaestia mangrovi TaxID=2873268 RepID=UPI001CA72FF9|nr:extracellular solute-binding protein [Hephaestia mangrovi]